MTELERRDTPAWWAVNAPLPAEGTPGSTDATHTGTLTLNPDYTPVNGAVTVWADTATEAATKALAGTVTVSLLGETVEYDFGPDTVGGAVADHKAFVATANGLAVEIGFEDMAGFGTADWDYDDRAWSASSLANPSGPVVTNQVFEAVFYGTLLYTVELTVTATQPDVYRWEYEVTNDSVGSWFPPEISRPGIESFFVKMGSSAADTTNPTGPGDWMTDTWSYPQIVYRFWSTGINDMDPALAGGYIPMGSSATFRFDTVPCPLVPGEGIIGIGLTGTDYQDSIPCSMVVPGQPLKAALQTVTFSDATDTHFKVDADAGDGAYPGDAQWTDPNMDGAITVVGEHQVPVGYVRSTPAVGATPAVDSKIKISATFQITQGTPTLGIWVRGDGPDGFKVPWTKATVAGNTVTLDPVVMLGKFTDKVNHYPSFNIVWQYSAFAGLAGRGAGTSKNEMFVTLAKPDATVLTYVTPLWLFCSGAKGTDNAADAIVKSYGPFTGANVKTHEDLDPLYRALWDIKRNLYYYKNWITASDRVTVTQLLESKDGQCQSWVDIFRYTLLEGGIPQNAFDKYIIGSRVAMISSFLWIKNWTFKAVGSSDVAPYTHVNTFNVPPPSQNWALEAFLQQPADDTKPWTYKWGANPEVEDSTGLPGQNNTNPRSIFNNHFVIRVGDSVYDPSYGTRFTKPAVGGKSAWEVACLAWKDASLAGVGTTLSYPDANGIARDKLLVVEASTTKTETIFGKSNW